MFSGSYGVGVTNKGCYMSKVERGEFTLPSEAALKRMAAFFSIDSDIMLAKAGKVDSELIDIILSDPVYYCALIRNKSAK